MIFFLRFILLPYYKIFRANLEAIIWITSLLILAFTPPEHDHYSICLFHNLGFRFCPGCGLGHSISYLFHGDIYSSLNAHPLGIFATAVLSYRIFQVVNMNIKNKKIKIEEYGESI